MRFLEVRLPAERLEEQRAFYGETLGLQSEGDVFLAGGTRIAFDPEREPRAVAHLAFNVPENLFAEAVDWAGERAELIEVGGRAEVSFPAWNAHSVYFLDPDENVLELIARHGLPNAREELSLLEVSEVGFPVPDVHGFAGLLTRGLGVELFDSAGDSFAAVGDERGLFIVSREGRNWFPTELPSRRCSIAVTVDAEGGRLELPGLPYEVQGSRVA